MTTLDNVEILSGHTDEATALVVDDYPYGYTLRCKIRYWIETHPTRGDRFCSQTTNPKKPGEVWNKPKKSTYCEVGVMVRDPENGHISWVGLHSWPAAPLLEAFQRLCFEHLTDTQRKHLHTVVVAHKIMARREALNRQAEVAAAS